MMRNTRLGYVIAAIAVLAGCLGSLVQDLVAAEQRWTKFGISVLVGLALGAIAHPILKHWLRTKG